MCDQSRETCIDKDLWIFFFLLCFTVWLIHSAKYVARTKKENLIQFIDLFLKYQWTDAYNTSLVNINIPRNYKEQKCLQPFYLSLIPDALQNLIV